MTQGELPSYAQMGTSKHRQQVELIKAPCFNNLIFFLITGLCVFIFLFVCSVCVSVYMCEVGGDIFDT